MLTTVITATTAAQSSVAGANGYSRLNARPKSSPPLSPQTSRLPPTASMKRGRFFHRLVHFQQMDFEYAFWQMIYLLVAPQKVYRNFQYRKQAKNQWSRDDPAFLLLISAVLLVTAVGFSLALSLGFVGFLRLVVWVLLVDYLAVGLLIASGMWYLTNRLMVTSTCENPPRSQVEWAYCFDVHLNALFSLLTILHLAQLPFLNLVVLPNYFISPLVGNTFWLIALGYYLYITFLGYDTLPFLRNTRALLYPFSGLIVLYVLSVALNCNLTLQLCYFYEYRAI